MRKAILHRGDDVAAVTRRLGVDVARGPLEALGLGVPLVAGEAAFCCEAVRVVDGRINPAGVSPGRFKQVGEACRNLPGFRWYYGDTRQHVVTYVGGWPFDVATVRPVAGAEAVEPYGPGDEVLRELHEISAEVLGGGRRLWLWGFGVVPEVEPIGPRVAAVGPRWVKGLARLLGLAYHERVEDATADRLVVVSGDPAVEAAVRGACGEVTVV